MLVPAVRIFRLSPLDKEKEDRSLASGRAAVALGRKVLAENPPPNIPKIAQPKTETPETPSSRPPDDLRIQTAIDRKLKAKGEWRSLERQHLSLANEHVGKAERVISEQTALIENLRCDGQDTKLAEETMRVFEANLQVMREHRELILRAIEETDEGL